MHLVLLLCMHFYFYYYYYFLLLIAVGQLPGSVPLISEEFPSPPTNSSSSQLPTSASQATTASLVHVGPARPEPNMLKILPIILSRISQNFLLLFIFILLSSLLFHNNAHLASFCSYSHLILKMLI